MHLACRPSPCVNLGPANPHHSPSTSLSLASGTRSSDSLSPPTSLPPAPSQLHAARTPHRTAAACARRGQPGRRAGMHAEFVCTRGPPPGGICWGKVPSTSADDATGVVAAIGGRPCCQSRSSGQSWSAEASLPLRLFDHASTTLLTVNSCIKVRL
jgi:hypothetical protein